MQNTTFQRFDLGNVVITPGALDLLTTEKRNYLEFLARHQSGDWGDLCQEDRQSNQQALRHGGRLLSAYRLPSGKKLWIITEATDGRGIRHSTCVLLPEEY